MKKRHHVLLLLFLAGIINDLDRSALSVAAPLIAKDLGLGPADLGFVFSSFFIGYALFNCVGGRASDRIEGQRVYALSMAAWSLFCALTAVATGFVSRLVIRVLFGMGGKGHFRPPTTMPVERPVTCPESFRVHCVSCNLQHP